MSKQKIVSKTQEWYDKRSTKAESNELSTTINQWREALSASEKPKHPEGKTLTELSTALGINRCTLKDRLIKSITMGTCKAYKDYRKNRPATVYVLSNKDD